MANDTIDVVAGGIRTAPVTDGAKLRLANHFAHLLAETDGFEWQEFLKACSPIGTDFSVLTAEAVAVNFEDQPDFFRRSIQERRSARTRP